MLRLIFVIICFSSLNVYGETTSTASANSKQASVNLNVASKSYGLSKNCHNFIQPDGSLGAWGQALISGIERTGTQCFYEGINFSYLCPKFSQLNRQRKQQFIVFLFATMAHFESSCRQNARAQGVNDIAAGLFQLEDSYRQRREAGRPSQCSPNGPTNTYAIDFQTKCVTAMFSNQYCQSGKNPGKHRSYWHKLNPTRAGSDQAITRIAKKFPYCK